MPKDILKDMPKKNVRKYVKKYILERKSGNIIKKNIENISKNIFHIK